METTEIPAIPYLQIMTKYTLNSSSDYTGELTTLVKWQANKWQASKYSGHRRVKKDASVIFLKSYYIS